MPRTQVAAPLAAVLLAAVTSRVRSAGLTLEPGGRAWPGADPVEQVRVLLAEDVSELDALLGPAATAARSVQLAQIGQPSIYPAAAVPPTTYMTLPTAFMAPAAAPPVQPGTAAVPEGPSMLAVAAAKAFGATPLPPLPAAPVAAATASPAAAWQGALPGVTVATPVPQQSVAALQASDGGLRTAPASAAAPPKTETKANCGGAGQPTCSTLNMVLTFGYNLTEIVGMVIWGVIGAVLLVLLIWMICCCCRPGKGAKARDADAPQALEDEETMDPSFTDEAWVKGNAAKAK